MDTSSESHTKRRLFKYILALLIATAAILFFDRHSQPERDQRLLQIVLTDISGIDKIELQSTDEQITLTAKAGEWLIEADNFLADARKLMRFLDKLQSTVFSDLVAKGKDNFAQFGLDNPTTLTISAGSAKVLELLSGNTRKGGGQYVSLKGEDRVYLLNQSLVTSTSSAYWELKTLLQLEAEQIKSVKFNAKTEISRTSAEADFVFKTKLPAGKQPDPIKLKQLPQMFASLAFIQRLGFDNEERRAALSTPHTIIVELFDSAKYKIETGKLTNKDEDKYFIQIKGEQGTEANAKIATLNVMMQKFSFVISPQSGRRLIESEFVKVAKN